MDTNWCFHCGNHISHSDSALYCSDSCRRADRDSSPEKYSLEYKRVSPSPLPCRLLPQSNRQYRPSAGFMASR
ncbi:hypothetical protein AYI68_g2849 [Smittium mucronatum]|uniref:Uncharacterized protein n=1 Tax=Smittium mucronatum TaxID=133383 RepID=A0A1R0H1K9_9FUNG|nr:hypothetical protein AYI68_g2849 [Smittium mucronatum]